MSELVKRLRFLAKQFEDPNCITEAADHIEALEDELETAKIHLVIAKNSNEFLVLANARIEELEAVIHKIDDLVAASIARAAL